MMKWRVVSRPIWRAEAALLASAQALVDRLGLFHDLEDLVFDEPLAILESLDLVLQCLQFLETGDLAAVELCVFLLGPVLEHRDLVFEALLGSLQLVPLGSHPCGVLFELVGIGFELGERVELRERLAPVKEPIDL